MNIRFWIALGSAISCNGNVNGQKFEPTKIDCNETQMLYPTKLIPDIASKSAEKSGQDYSCIDVFDKDLEAKSAIKCVCGWYDKCSDHNKKLTSSTMYVGGIEFRQEITLYKCCWSAAFDYLIENCVKGNKKNMIEYVNDGKNVTILINIRYMLRQAEYTICTGAIRDEYFCYPDDHYPNTVGEDAAWVTGLVLGVVLPLAICRPSYTACVDTDNCCAKTDGSVGECAANVDGVFLCNVGAADESCATAGSTNECQVGLICSADLICDTGCAVYTGEPAGSSITYSIMPVDSVYAGGTIVSIICADTFYLTAANIATADAVTGITCTEGDWVDTTGVTYACAQGCSAHDPAAITDGTVTYNPTVVGTVYEEATVATVDCDTGFYLSVGGTPTAAAYTATCTTGVWSGTVTSFECTACDVQGTECTSDVTCCNGCGGGPSYCY